MTLRFSWLTAPPTADHCRHHRGRQLPVPRNLLAAFLNLTREDTSSWFNKIKVGVGRREHQGWRTSLLLLLSPQVSHLFWCLLFFPFKLTVFWHLVQLYIGTMVFLTKFLLKCLDPPQSCVLFSLGNNRSVIVPAYCDNFMSIDKWSAINEPSLEPSSTPVYATSALSTCLRVMRGPGGLPRSLQIQWGIRTKQHFRLRIS